MRRAIGGSVTLMSAECVASQADITAEIARIGGAYLAAGGHEAQPRLDYPPYRSSALRHPTHPPLIVDPEEVERWAPCFGERTSTRSTRPDRRPTR